MDGRLSFGCMTFKSGKVIWQERLPGSYSASPVLVGEHIYCTSNDGVLRSQLVNPGDLPVTTLAACVAFPVAQ